MTAQALREALEGVMTIEDAGPPGSHKEAYDWLRQRDEAYRVARAAIDAHKQPQAERLGFEPRHGSLGGACLHCGEPAESHLCPELAAPPPCAGATVPEEE